MRWKAKEKKYDPYQWHWKFLLWPRKSNGYWIWLEWVYAKYTSQVWDKDKLLIDSYYSKKD